MVFLRVLGTTPAHERHVAAATDNPCRRPTRRERSDCEESHQWQPSLKASGVAHLERLALCNPLLLPKPAMV